MDFNKFIASYPQDKRVYYLRMYIKRNYIFSTELERFMQQDERPKNTSTSDKNYVSDGFQISTNNSS